MQEQTTKFEGFPKWPMVFGLQNDAIIEVERMNPALFKAEVQFHLGDVFVFKLISTSTFKQLVSS